MEKLKLPNLNVEKISLLKKKALINIKNDPFFFDFIKTNNLTDEEIMDNASKFIRVKEDKKKCESCNTKCHKNPNQVQLDLVFDDEHRTIDIEFNICDYYKKINELKKHYLYIDFPIDWLEYDFSKELVSNDYKIVRKNILVKLIKIVEDNLTKGIFLSGDNRLGKSFILALFSKKYIEKTGKKVAFVSSSDLFLNLTDLNFSDKDALKDTLIKLMEVDLLIIDGFGNEYKSDFVRDNYVYPLLSSRLEKNKLTLFTSNFTIKEIAEMYTTSNASKPKVRQLYNILLSLTEEIELTGHAFLF